MCKGGAIRDGFLGEKRVLLCLHMPSPPALDHGTERSTVDRHWRHSQLNLKNSVWKRCYGISIRQKLPFPVPQRSTLLRSTAATASFGFHTREKGVWQKLPFVSGMRPAESVLQPFCWFLGSHPSWCWEYISECHYQLQRKNLDQNNHIGILTFCISNQSHRVWRKKLVCLEYCVSELITLLALDFFFNYSPILLKLFITNLQINLFDQQKKNEKHLWKSLKQPSLAFAIVCYSNSCWLEGEKEMWQDKVTRETSSKKERFAVCRLDWLI